ncbi:MAG TPA: gamma-glutamylcyclotransferase family protein [Sphingomonadaceae bacterium]
MRLFIYGTLLDGLAHGEAARLIQGLAPGIPASVAGALRLVEEPLGCYPVLVPGVEGRVRGKVVECPAEPQWWAELDAYEGPDYRRWTVVAELADGSEAQVQAYICLIADTDGLEPIPHGDFARFVAETGRKVFGT